MKKVISFCFLLIVSACQTSPPPKAHLRRIVDEQNKKLEALFKEGNVDKLVTMYCDSAKLCANEESEIYIGREAIKKFWTAAMEGSKLIEMETETLSVDGTEDLIYETGKSNEQGGIQRFDIYLSFQVCECMEEATGRFI
jgi:hypothetical protein